MDYEINASSKEAIELLLVDLESQVNKKITSIIMNAKLACEQLKQVGFLNSLPIEKKVKNMTVKEFNEQFGANVLECVQHELNTAAQEEGEGIMRRKRAHLETPARTAVGPMIQRTPLYVFLGSSCRSFTHFLVDTHTHTHHVQELNNFLFPFPTPIKQYLQNRITC